MAGAQQGLSSPTLSSSTGSPNTTSPAQQPGAGDLGAAPMGQLQPGTSAALPLLPSCLFFPRSLQFLVVLSSQQRRAGRGGAAVTEHPVTRLRAWGAIKGLSMGLVIQCVHTHARTPPAADTEEDPGRRTRWGKLWLCSSCVSWRQASRAEGFLLLSSPPSHAAPPAPAGVLLPLSKRGLRGGEGWMRAGGGAEDRGFPALELESVFRRAPCCSRAQHRGPQL